MEIPIQRPNLVLMAGFGGSGKTTLAYALGTLLKWPVIDKDVFKARLMRAGPEMSSEIASTLAYELLFAQAHDFLVQQRLSVILDTSAAFPIISTTAHELTRMADARLRILFCKASDQVRRARVQWRNEHDAGKRQMMINLTMLDKDDWWRFDHLPLEHLIELDTTLSFNEYLRLALLFLREERPNLCPLR